MKRLRRFSLPFLAPAVLGLGAGFATFAVASPEMAPVTAEVRRQVVDALDQLLADLYVIPETADRLRERLHQRLDDGAYDELGREEFARQLTEDLQDLSHDAHLRVLPGPELGDADVDVEVDADGPIPDGARVVVRGPGGEAPAGHGRRIVIREGDAPEGDAGPVIVREEGDDGGVFDHGPGIHPAEMLPGNVGLMRIDLFKPLDYEKDAAVQAMQATAGADAMIFDLRRCSGGTPEMVHFLQTYLYPPGRKHLLTYHFAREAPDSAYTLDDVPGPRRPDVPVYVLTSRFTASGGEEFTYVLKHHGRATVVGKTTAGGGHGGGVHPVAAGFHAFIPDFRPVHPVTGGGWEGVGVVPDVECPSPRAQLVAHRDALRRIAATADAARAAELEEISASLQEELEQAAAPFPRERYVGHAGSYGDGLRTIFVEDDGLYIQRRGGPKLRLVRGDTDDEFSLELLPAAKIRFVREDAGKITAIDVFNPQMGWETSPRDDDAGAGTN